MTFLLGLTVFVDLITAVVTGVVLAALAFVKMLADDQLSDIGDSDTTEEEREILAQARDRIMLFEFSGPLSFGAAADLGHTVRERSAGVSRALILDFSRLSFIDVSAARAVETIACDARLQNKRVYCTGMSKQVRADLAGLNADHCIPSDTYFEKRIDALRAALAMIDQGDADDALANPG